MSFQFEEVERAIRRVLIDEPLRVAWLTSAERGKQVLEDTWRLHRSGVFEFVGVATDNVSIRAFNAHYRDTYLGQRQTSAGRIASYVPDFCKRHKIELCTRPLDDQFFERMSTVWRPHLILSNVYGYNVPERIFGWPALGTLGFHACRGVVWPDPICGGGRPYSSLFASDPERRWFNMAIAMFYLNKHWDRGRLRAYSREIRIDRNAPLAETHRLMAPLIIELICQELPKLLTERKDRVKALQKLVFGSEEKKTSSRQQSRRRKQKRDRRRSRRR